MKAVSILALLVAVAAAAVAVVALLSEDEPEEFTLTYTDADADAGVEDSGIGTPRQLGDPGSGTALSIPLFDEAEEEVGTLNAACIQTNDAADHECLATATIPDGSLVLDGVLTAGGTAGPPGAVRPGAVIGGTGKYEGAYGSFEAVGGEGGGARIYTIEVKVP
jgi:hypothetical protein